MAAETTSGFLIDGKIYEMPTLDSLTLDESQVLFERSTVTQDDFVREFGEDDEEYDARVAKMMRHPGFWAALIQIAYQRGNPKAKLKDVEFVVGNTNRIEALSGLRVQDEEETQEIPLASTLEPKPSSSSDWPDRKHSSKDLSETSGSDSAKGSGVLADPLVPITTLRSATSST